MYIKYREVMKVETVIISRIYASPVGGAVREASDYECRDLQNWLSPLMLWVRISLRRGVLDTTCDKVGQWLATGGWFSPATPVSSTNKSDHHDIAEILLKVVFSTINLTLKTDIIVFICCFIMCLTSHWQIIFSIRINLLILTISLPEIKSKT